MNCLSLELEVSEIELSRNLLSFIVYHKFPQVHSVICVHLVLSISCFSYSSCYLYRAQIIIKQKITVIIIMIKTIRAMLLGPCTNIIITIIIIIVETLWSRKYNDIQTQYI